MSNFMGWRRSTLVFSFMSRDVIGLVRGCAEQQQDVLSVRDWGFLCILLDSLISRHAVPLQVNLPGSYWVGASKALIFWAHHSSDHFSREASLITSGTRGILEGRGKPLQNRSCKWGNPAHGTPSFSWERHGMAVSPTCCKASLWQNSSNQCCSANHGSHLR